MLIQRQNAANKCSGKRSAGAESSDNRSGVELQRRGATLAIRSLARYFGSQLPDKVPYIWDVMMDTLASARADFPDFPCDSGGYAVSVLVIFR